MNHCCEAFPAAALPLKRLGIRVNCNKQSCDSISTQQGWVLCFEFGLMLFANSRSSMFVSISHVLTPRQQMCKHMRIQFAAKLAMPRGA